MQDGRDEPAIRFVAAAPLQRLRAARWLEVAAGDVAVLLYDLAGAVCATASVCPHHAAWLAQGSLGDTHVDCPRHQGRFDIATGRRLRGPDCPDLRTYPTRIAGGQVFVGIPSAQA